MDSVPSGKVHREADPPERTRNRKANLRVLHQYALESTKQPALKELPLLRHGSDEIQPGRGKYIYTLRPGRTARKRHHVRASATSRLSLHLRWIDIDSRAVTQQQCTHFLKAETHFLQGFKKIRTGTPDINSAIQRNHDKSIFLR